MDALTQAIFLATVNNRLIEYFVSPLFEAYWPDGRRWLLYVAALTGGLLSFLAGIDLLAAAGVDLGQPANLIVSAVIVGGGANLIHDVLSEGRLDGAG